MTLKGYGSFSASNWTLLNIRKTIRTGWCQELVLMLFGLFPLISAYLIETNALHKSCFGAKNWYHTFLPSDISNFPFYVKKLFDNLLISKPLFPL